MKNFLPEYDDKFPYNNWVSGAIAQGKHDLVEQFLQKVPNTDKKGDL